MPLFPKLAGGVVIRERPSRYEGEPRYRRLDFIRPKSEDKSDSWPVVYNSEPVRALQVYGYNPYQSYHHGHWHPGYYQAYARPGAPAMQPQLAHFPPGHPIYRVPAPPLSGEHAPRQIEQRPELIPLEGSDSEDEIAAIFEGDGHKEGKKKKNKSRSQSRIRPSGHSIFDSSSEEEDWLPKKKKNTKKARGRSR